MAKHQAKHSSNKKSKQKKVSVPREREGMSRGAKAAVGVLVTLALAAGGAYGAGVYYFQDHFMPNTTLNGQDVSWQSEAQVANQIDSAVSSYSNTITAGDFSYTVTAEDIDLESDGGSCATNALSSVNKFAWPYEVMRPHAYTEDDGISYDEQKLNDIVSQALDDYNASATQPQDAAIAFDEQSQSYVVNPQVDGDQVHKDVVLQQALDSVSTMQADTAVDDSAKVTAAVTSDDPGLNQTVQSANAVLDQTIPVVNASGTTVATITRDDLVKWVSLGEDGSVNVDQSSVAAWVKQNLASAVPAEDNDFKYALNASDTTAALMSSIQGGSSSAAKMAISKTSKPRKVEATQEAPEGVYDPGLGSYIDVDLGNQYARYFGSDGSVKWESQIVSGNTSEDRGTPTGTYSINSKGTNVTLTGADENHDGEPDYKSHVTYWMPFVGNSIGLHDATWRGDFGGDIYSTSGSHGCVNLPYSKAESLYQMVPVGTTVYVHW